MLMIEPSPVPGFFRFIEIISENHTCVTDIKATEIERIDDYYVKTKKGDEYFFGRSVLDSNRNN